MLNGDGRTGAAADKSSPPKFWGRFCMVMGEPQGHRNMQELFSSLHSKCKHNSYIQNLRGERSGRRIWRNNEVFEDGSLSFTCEGGEQSEGETEREVVKDLKDSQTCEYRFYKTLY